MGLCEHLPNMCFVKLLVELWAGLASLVFLGVVLGSLVSSGRKLAERGTSNLFSRLVAVASLTGFGSWTC